MADDDGEDATDCDIREFWKSVKMSVFQSFKFVGEWGNNQSQLYHAYRNRERIISLFKYKSSSRSLLYHDLNSIHRHFKNKGTLQRYSLSITEQPR